MQNSSRKLHWLYYFLYSNIFPYYTLLKKMCMNSNYDEYKNNQSNIKNKNNIFILLQSKTK